MKPRTLWACQPVASMISLSVAPFAFPISSNTVDVLLPSRAAAFFAVVGLRVFLAALSAFLVAAAVGLALFASFWPWGAFFFEVASLAEEAASGASWAACGPALPSRR